MNETGRKKDAESVDDRGAHEVEIDGNQQRPKSSREIRKGFMIISAENLQDHSCLYEAGKSGECGRTTEQYEDACCTSKLN